MENLALFRVRTDADNSWFSLFLDEFERLYLGKIKLLVKNVEAGTDEINRQKYEMGIYGKLRINSFLDREKHVALLNNWTERNVGLITETNTEQVRKLEGFFKDSAFSGVRAKALESGVAEILARTQSRIELIALDQVQKLGGQLDQLRQTSAGIEGYYWRSARDERVRAKHAELEGQYFRWDSPPLEGHPGHPIRCRCDAEPAIDRLIGADETEIDRLNEERNKKAKSKSRAYHALLQKQSA